MAEKEKTINTEELFNALMENIALGISIVDTEYKIIMTNSTLGQWLKKDTESLMGKECFREYEHRDAVCAHCPGRKALETSQAHSVDTGSVREDGTHLFVRIYAIPLFDDQHKPKGFIEIIENTTDRKKAEDALRASETRYKSYIELTGQLAWTTNAAGEVQEDIPAWRKFTGQSYEDVKGYGWTKALHPDDAERATEVWKKAVATKSAYETEYRVKRHDGVYRHFLAHGVPVLNEDGSIREWVGTCIDITERKQMENELKKKVRDLEAFHKVTVGRELKMEELKKRIKGLEVKLSEKG